MAISHLDIFLGDIGLARVQPHRGFSFLTNLRDGTFHVQWIEIASDNFVVGSV